MKTKYQNINKREPSFYMPLSVTPLSAVSGLWMLTVAST